MKTAETARTGLAETAADRGSRRLRTPLRRLGVSLAVAAAALFASGVASAATFTVNTIDDLVVGACDVMHCSLREAIIDANANGAGHDLIAYDIALPPPNTITPATPYPPITSEVTIDGTTEPDYAGTPIVEIDGTLAGASGGDPGFWLLGGNSTFRGHVVNRFASTSAVQIQGLGGSRVEGNYVGTDVTGTVALPNYQGIVVFGASNNTIGGTTAQTRNVVSGNNGTGIELRSGAFEGPAANNLVIGNRVGTDVTGTLSVPNGYGMTVGGDGNTIGGSSAGERNIVSGNSAPGMLIYGAGNLVQGNYVGVDATGVAPLGNRLNGIDISGPRNRLVGNVVSGNGQEGVQLASVTAEANVLEGNLIGTDATGTVGLGNGSGFRGVVVAFGADGNRIGGFSAAARNIISGNGVGIWIATPDTQGNRVEGNYIGTDVTGTNPLPNREGIQLSANSNWIGGTAAGAGNVISGNQAFGVNILGGAVGNAVWGNLIGTEPDGTTALPNGLSGVTIGTGNGNAIGEAIPGAGNTIAFNGGAGVEVLDGVGNGILGNSIHSNAQLGIELAPSGPTPNDPLDADTGPNEYQNSPVLTSSGGTLSSAPNTMYRIEFFSNRACDPSGYGEGETFLSAILVTTDALGTASFAVPSGANVTATAFDTNTSNTSEFSACRRGPTVLVLEPKAGSNPVGSEHCVSATVRDAAGSPVPGVNVRFAVTGAHALSGQAGTDADGVARFCYTGAQAGEDTIRAFADSDGDAAEDAGEPADTAVKTWTSVARGKVVGKGSFQSNVGGANFEVDASPAGGSFRVQAGTRHTFAATSVESFTRAGNTVSFRGNGTWNGAAGYTYHVSFVDNGFPGRNDTIDVVVRNAAGVVVLTSGGRKTLKTGNVTVSD